MKIKDLIKQDAGFQYVFDSMDFMSSAGRHAALDFPFLTDEAAITKEHDHLDAILDSLQSADSKRPYTDLKHCLMQLHDLQGTLGSLADRTPLNEVELFELKNLASITAKAREAAASMHLAEVLPLPALDEVYRLLDPDHTGTPNFYVYDTYHPRLAPLRRELRSLQEHGGDPMRISELLAEQNDLQQQVCTELSDRLRPHHSALTQAMTLLAYADFLRARAELCRQWGLARPTLGSSLRYCALFNPRLREHNLKAGLRYQAVDVAAQSGVTLITGANMAGKTVLLKSLATAQAMVQCGLFAPARQAEVAVVEAIVPSIGDGQNEMNGLSSYASEIIKISDIVRRSRSERLLVLIDEPARTTNPIEGKALVQAIIAMLNSQSSISLITTHYDRLGTDCHRLRVKGFVEDMDNVPLTPQNINRFIDYSLTEETGTTVPHEALRIASILGCDEQLLAEAKRWVRPEE